MKFPQIVAFFGTLLVFGAGGIHAADDGAPFRLPATVIPQAYQLDLEILPDQERFSGQVEIEIEITEAVDRIWLHGQHLAVSTATVTTAAGESFSGTYRQVTDDGMSVVLLDRQMASQRATLRIEFDAPFGSALNGLYKVRVGDDSYAFTQFESVYARKVFPCFDEPLFKTPFDISITTRQNDSAIGNTKSLQVTSLPGNLQRTDYAVTERLPTYLIAFAVGPLDVVDWSPVSPSEFRKSPLPLRGIATRGKGSQLEFALRNTEKILLLLEDYFAAPYPFDKLDIVAVPDFNAGAMENAGLITYRESSLLFDESPPVAQVRRYGMIHTHELAHQWFGNFVTMPWWDDIWLNESFATWLQAKVAHQWDAQYHFDRETQVRAMRAMAADSLVSARRIREPVNTTADILNAFDSITYQKGGAVLEMMEQYIGADNFRNGLRRHMQRFAFDSATVYDLMDSLQDAAGPEFAIKAVFESFLFQAGTPYLTVRKHCQDGAARISFSQQRYLPLGSEGKVEQTWTMPVCFAYGLPAPDGTQRAEQCVLLTEEEVSLPIGDGQACPEWLMPNSSGAGYFRWRLADDDLAAVADVFSTGLNAKERASFVDSLVAGVNNGELTMRQFFDYLPLAADAEEATVVQTPLRTYARMYANLVEPEQRGGARQFAVELFADRLAALKNDPSAEAASLRYRLVRFLAVDIGVPGERAALIDNAHRYLGYRVKQDAGALDPDLLRPALIVSAQDGSVAYTQFLIKRFLASENSRFRHAVIEALAFVSEPASRDLVHELVMGAEVRGNEFYRWVYWILHPSVRDVNWPWVQSNLDAILEIGGDDIRREAPVTFSNWLCSSADAEKLQAMFAERNDTVPSERLLLQQALEKIALCTAFKTGQSAGANEFFEGRAAVKSRRD